MNKSRLLGAVCACFITCIANLGSASTVIYDNGVSSIESSTVSQPSAEQIVADDFSLAANTNLTGIEWRGVYSREQVPNDFTILIHADIGGSPAAGAMYTFNLGNSIAMAGNSDAFSYTADIHLMLDAGTYWISIFNNLPDNYPRNRWSWIHQFDTANGNSHYRSQIGSVYTNTVPYKTDFKLYGTVVPIPPALWLFSSGLLGLVGTARRKKA